jgi:hypothetical protein
MPIKNLNAKQKKMLDEHQLTIAGNDDFLSRRDLPLTKIRQLNNLKFIFSTTNNYYFNKKIKIAKWEFFSQNLSETERYLQSIGYITVYNENEVDSNITTIMKHSSNVIVYLSSDYWLRVRAQLYLSNLIKRKQLDVNVFEDSEKTKCIWENALDHAWSKRVNESFLRTRRFLKRQ